MSETIYTTTINKIGPEAEAFIAEGMIITFMDNAPAELADYCILHEGNDLKKDIIVGDQLKLGGNVYAVTAVGDIVNKNLNALGHITIRFDGATEAELPGTLSVEEKAIDTINVGDTITIER